MTTEPIIASFTPGLGRGTGFAARRGRGETLFAWHPGDGNCEVSGSTGVQTLRLEDTDMTLEQILAAIRPEKGSEMPRLELGGIAVQGVAGRIVLGNETVRFEGIERLAIGGYSYYPARNPA